MEMVAQGMTFAEVVNEGGDLNAAITAVLEGVNRACRENKDNPRDAGVEDPQWFIDNPLRLVSADLVDRDTGKMVVAMGNVEKTVEFCADDVIDEFCQMDLLEAL